MSDDEDTYCRLCAEPTPIEQLISANEDVAITSKILTKMSWINVDITQNTLPNTICFACFDSLERTWKFLHNVRAAQQKLFDIFRPKLEEENSENFLTKTVDSIVNNAGKPVNKDWETFTDSKGDIKEESESKSLLEIPIIQNVKIELDSDNDYSNKFDENNLNSTDSDAPLIQVSVKKKKIKKKKRIKFDTEILESNLNDKEAEAIPLSMMLVNLTWNEYNCLCATCNAPCKNITSLQLHSLQLHSSCCVFKCSECEKVVHSFQSFIKHARGHNKALRYCCEYCNKQFSRILYLRNHLNSEHSNLEHVCANCGAIFENTELLDEHILTYAKSYKKRMKRTREKLEYELKCEHCHKEFKLKTNLQQHRLVHTQRSRDFFCHICGKMFFTKGTLSTHMNTHEETKPFKCEYCPLAFRSRGNLQCHVSIHSGARPFVCEQCGKSFRVKRQLKSHSIMHTDLMPYVCEFCNKSFRFKTRLNLHLRQHTGAKPYKCVFCQRDFTNGSNFKKHMRRRHNIDTSKKKYNNIVTNVQENDTVNGDRSF